MADIEIYSSPFCPFCWMARLLLRKRGVRYRLIPIRMYLGFKLPTANLRDMVRRTGGDSTIPQIFVDGQYLGDDDTLLELARSGELESRLGGST
jgi:glutaredoxin 3